MMTAAQSTTSLTDDSAAMILRQWDIGQPSSIERLELSFNSFTWKVKSERGQFFLKCQPATVDREHWQRLGLLQRALSDRGIAAPYPIPSSNHEMGVFESNRLWTLSTYLDSDRLPFEWTSPQWRIEHCQSAGVLLGKLHRTSAQSAQLFRALLDDFQPSRLEPWNLEAFREAQLVSRSRAEDVFLRDVLAMVSRRLSGIGDVLAAINTAGDEPGVLLHGDFHLGNLIFLNDAATAVVDFEYASWGDPRFDLGYSAMLICSSWSVKSDGKLNPHFLNAFLSGYESVREISIEKLRPTLQYYMSYAAYLLLYWLLKRRISCTPSLTGYFERALIHSLNTLDELAV
jgi:Ser/Thr protein kinase RdoA (MazF antagonist)